MGNANAVIAKRQTHPALWHCFCNTPTYHNTLCIYTLVIICHLQYIAEFFWVRRMSQFIEESSDSMEAFVPTVHELLGWRYLCGFVISQMLPFQPSSMETRLLCMTGTNRSVWLLLAIPQQWLLLTLYSFIFNPGKLPLFSFSWQSCTM